MKRKFLSAVLAAAMVVSTAAAAGASQTAAADEVPDYGLPASTADGVILHCFDWSFDTIKENLPEIAAAGYTTIQTSPVQQPKDYGEWLNQEGQWWKLYQPLSFTIATENSWLGTKDELQSLCEEADKYGIKIICDVVTNHMANQDGNSYLTVCHDIKKYEPEIYAQKNDTFHQLKKGTDDDNKLEWIVCGELNKLPDLNTANPLVQERVTALLKECIDVGVDGFRFDAAKHIETPADGEYASDFWPNVTGAANEYAASKGVELYMYGEILNTPGKGRLTTDYTQYLDVIDNKMGDGTLAYVKTKNAKMVATALNYHYEYEDPANLVVWAESHDTYMDGKTYGATDAQIAQAWALVAARGKSHPLFFARPNELMGLAGDTSWKSTVVSEVNHFHNAMVGTDDTILNDGDLVAVQRGDRGIVIVNLGDSKEITLQTSGMKADDYVDTVTGKMFKVDASGVISGTIGESGIAVIYNDARQNPKVLFSEENTTFRRDSFSVTLTLENAEKGTYSVNGGEAVSFSGSKTVEIGSIAKVGETVTLTATASNVYNKTTTETHTYTKLATDHSGVFVYYDNSQTNFKNVYAYGYYEYIDDNGRKVQVAHDGQWPGTRMEYDAEKGLYVYEVPSDIPVGKGSVIITNAQGTGKFETAGMTIPAQVSVYDAKQKKLVDPNGVTLKYGDINSDGSIASDDALNVLRYSTGAAGDFTDAQIAQADVDLDGSVTSNDAFLVLRTSVGMTDAGNHTGEDFTFGGSSGDPTPTPTPTPAPSGTVFYAINSAGWIFRDGCKLWLMNNDTKETVEMTKSDPTSDDSKYSYVDLPAGWTNISLHRTQWNMTVEESEGDPAYSVWNCGTIPEGKNAYSITDNGKGKFKSYTP